MESYYLSFYGSVGVEDEHGTGEELAIPKHGAVLNPIDLNELCETVNICPCELFRLYDKDGECICHSREDCSLMDADAWEDALQMFYPENERSCI